MDNKIQKLHHVPDPTTNDGNVIIHQTTNLIIKYDYEYNDPHKYKMHLGDGSPYFLNYFCATKWQFRDEDMVP